MIAPMPRPLRIAIPGGFYHLVNRGDRSEAIFLDDADRGAFLEVLGETCGKTGWKIHAYCLMPNHFHLVAETPEANLVLGMKWLLGTYSTRLNRRHRLKGHLFAGRYRSLMIDGGSDECIRSIGDYVHLNPARAKLIPASEPLRSYRWCSFRDLVEAPGSRPNWLSFERLFGATGIGSDTPRGRSEFERRLEDLRNSAATEDWNRIRKDWCFGSESFRQQLMLASVGAISRGGDARARQEATEAKAEAIVLEEFESRGLQERLLDGLAKGDRQKVAIARRLRQETSVTLKWIANRLRMGTWTHTANCIYATASKQTKARGNGARRATPNLASGVATVQNSDRSGERAAEVGVEELPVHCL